MFFFSFFRFLVKYFQLCICIVTSLLLFVVNKAYQYFLYFQHISTAIYSLNLLHILIQARRPSSGTAVYPHMPILRLDHWTLSSIAFHEII